MAQETLTDIVNNFRPSLDPYETLYKHIHRHPELSLQEENTASTCADHLNNLPGFSVHSNIGGHGLAAVLENGSGKTVLLRADIDALPVEEQTGLPYASRVRMKDDDGVEKPVMHACGHDMHLTSMLAAAELLHKAREKWKGTIILLFQPNEERGAGDGSLLRISPLMTDALSTGAKAMIADGLYDKIPVPDIVLGQHLQPLRAGVIGTRRGLVASAADGLRITLYGRGGHGAMPHRTIDPVVIAAHVVVRLQTIVAREVDPNDSSVVTVACVQAGMTENIIADYAVLKLNVRNINAKTRDKVLAAIRRMVNAECQASGADKEPLIEPTSHFPFTNNDEAITKELEKTFGEHFGDQYDLNAPRLGGSEDFPILATARDRPYCFWTVGCIDPDKWDEAEKKGTLLEDIPVNHSPFFAPVIQPTMKAGVDALAVAALTFLK
ncbi:MAG: hypothetical protein M1812_005531 [Candelaria pacifica]|nr:MAG: hypothetical protein M1812_005531 [Candelaria pacifica]